MPLNIDIKDNNECSVYAALNGWSDLTQSTKKALTRNVLIEKISPVNKQRNEIINRWNNMGLLSGLNSNNLNISRLLDNQANSIMNEAQFSQLNRNNRNNRIGVSSRGFGIVNKKTWYSKIKSFFTSIWNKVFSKKTEKIFTNTDPFVNLAFPIVRQVFAQTIALDLVPVQPMSLPTGMLFYMDVFSEREDVFTRIVIFEKYKPRKPYMPIYSAEDYYIPTRPIGGRR
jgi:hypothetical protein